MTSTRPRSPGRLLLRPYPWADVEALVSGRRRPGWAADYPADGDAAIASLLHQGGPPPTPGHPDPWGHRQVVETASTEVVGGIGFHGPPERGVAEVGYGIVASRQGRGYASEALELLLAAAWAEPDLVAVVAGTEAANVASQRVLVRAGFNLEAGGQEMRWRLVRPGSSATSPSGKP